MNRYICYNLNCSFSCPHKILIQGAKRLNRILRGEAQAKVEAFGESQNET